MLKKLLKCAAVTLTAIATGAGVGFLLGLAIMSIEDQGASRSPGDGFLLVLLMFVGAMLGIGCATIYVSRAFDGRSELHQQSLES